MVGQSRPHRGNYPLRGGVIVLALLLLGALGLTTGCAKKQVAARATAPVWVEYLAFSPDGKTLAAVTDQVVRLWEMPSGKEKLSFQGHTGTITGIAFAPDGKKLITGSQDHTLILWDAATGKEERVFKGHNIDLTAVAVSPDGRLLASGASHQSPFISFYEVKLWDAATGTCL